MKQTFLLAGLLTAWFPVVYAVDLNTEAMKTMQKEGHKIVAESQSGRAFKTSNGLCLDAASGVLAVRKCHGKNNNQKWRFDDKKRLVADNGKCVDGASLKKCAGTASQKWKLDGKKRLANNAKQCLQTQNHPPKAGGKVTAAACAGGPNQAWK